MKLTKVNKMNVNAKRRQDIIDKASGNCWWVKQYIVGSLHFYKETKRKRR
tara:strand:+ start:665 stop:814 length:150 start_codon:yes stop_codon:yes gene_type:complete